MSLSIEIQQKPNVEKQRKVNQTNQVFELEEVREIRNAVQEHLLFIGLDNANNIRNISLLGMGTSRNMKIDTKYIVRTALVTASDKVILVHNHPSNSLKPSKKDIHITNLSSKVLEVFNIELLDHIIVTEDKYSSVMRQKLMEEKFENESTKIMDNVFLLEENEKLKEQVVILMDKLQEYEQLTQEEEEEFE